jgi:hypothetical protein
VEFPRLGAQPSAAKAKASAPPVQAPLVKPVKTGPKEQKLPKHMRSHRGKDYWELHDQLVLVLLSVFPVMARHNVLTHVLCEVSLPSLQHMLCGRSALHGLRIPNQRPKISVPV